MASEGGNCYFLDACILLPQKNKRYAESCEDFLKQTKSNCYVSSSVKNTILSLLKDAYDRITKEIQANLFSYMMKSKLAKVTSRDGLAFEGFFHEMREDMRKEGATYVYYEMIGQIESWIVSQLRLITLGRSISCEDFLAGITLRFSEIYEMLKSSIDIVESKEISPHPLIQSEVTLRKVKKIEDIVNLACAIDYEFRNNVWVVFVTFDEDDILSNKEALFDVCALCCSKPMYAQDHFAKFSRMGRPISYYSSIKNHSHDQISFAANVEKSIGKKIIV